MSVDKKNPARSWVLAASVVGMLYAGVSMADYVPFPGKIRVEVVSVDAPDEILVNYETWPGFRRNTLIRLPGIEIPRDTPQSDDCEREKAARVLDFSRQFIDEAKKVFVNDMRMETSASEEAFSDILTDKGSLTQALKKEGLARPDSVAPETSWCQ